jgi:hypothetical protein
MLARAEAEGGAVAVARHQLEVLRERRELVKAETAQLEVTAAKYAIRAPAVATVVQTQYIWPGELAQPGTAIASVLDPSDKYVQVYVPSPTSAASASASGSRSSSTARPGCASRARSASSPTRRTSRPRRSRRGATAWGRSTAPRSAS